MTIRSQRIALATSAVANTAVTVFTCPAGHRALIKDICLTSLATTPGLGGTSVLDAGGVLIAVLTRGVMTKDVPQNRLPAYVVLEPGDKLQAFVTSTTGGGWTCMAGGVLFDL